MKSHHSIYSRKVFQSWKKSDDCGLKINSYKAKQACNFRNEEPIVCCCNLWFLETQRWFSHFNKTPNWGDCSFWYKLLPTCYIDNKLKHKFHFLAISSLFVRLATHFQNDLIYFDIRNKKICIILKYEYYKRRRTDMHYFHLVFVNPIKLN